MSVFNMIREMREAVLEFRQAYAYICSLTEEGEASIPRPGKMDPHKASMAANLVSKNHGERNKATVTAHSAAATAHAAAHKDAMAAGKTHLAATHAKARDYHLSHPHGPGAGQKPVVKAPVKPMMKKKPAGPVFKSSLNPKPSV